VHPIISALRKSQIIFVILLGKSFQVLSIQLDTSLKPRDPWSTVACIIIPQSGESLGESYSDDACIRELAFEAESDLTKMEKVWFAGCSLK
jgi:hypothetical protein